jgi:hypothetical protein
MAVWRLSTKERAQRGGGGGGGVRRGEKGEERKERNDTIRRGPRTERWEGFSEKLR